jgi:selenocysteine lyase/cysteine desulfurase
MPLYLEAMSKLDFDLVQREFLNLNGPIYLNTGCCGRKPVSVLRTMEKGWAELNENPCRTTFMEPLLLERGRQAVAELLQVSPQNIFLALSTTNALQIIMHSFLLQAGDELVTTDDEHGSLSTIAEYLREVRGIIIRRKHTDPFKGSQSHCLGLLDLVTAQTKLVAVSEIGCYTGWRPQLDLLVEQLEEKKVPLLIDGAHTPGQGSCRPARYPMWVGSGHKWLGGPNGTAFGYVKSEFIPRLQTVALGDKFFERRQANPYDLKRLETCGTSDVVRWLGLAAAIQLQIQLEPEAVAQYQLGLVRHLRERLEIFGPTFRTPPLVESVPQETTSMVTVWWQPEQLKVAHLQEYLWNKHQIAVQVDFLHTRPAHGLRVSCHVANTVDQLDRLIHVLPQAVN